MGGARRVAGRHEGTLLAGGRRLPFAVTVWNFSLPDRLSFVPQMNAYSLPGHERDVAPVYSLMLATEPLPEDP